MIDRRAFFKRRVPKYQKDIVLYAREVLRFEPDEWQKDVFASIVKNRYTAVKSGQGVGKTGSEAVVLLWFLTCFPFPRVVCTAPTKQQLHDVLWSEVSKWQSNSPLLSEILHWTKTYIYMVGYEKRWFAVARTATKPENMQGFHEDNMLFIVDEASGVAEPIMDAIMGTLSGENNKLLLCGNPTKTSGAFYDAFHASRAIFSCHTVNSEDSPRTNKQNISLLERKYGRNSNVFRVRVLGEFPVQEDDVFISLSLIEQAIMSEVDDFIGKISIGVDVARYGDDETVIATKIGNHISIPTIRQGQSLMQTVGDIVTTYFKLIQEYPDYTGSITVIIDDTGLGGGVTDRLAEVKAERQMYRLVIVPVNFASSPPNTDGDVVHYKDMTTYLWAEVRSLLESKQISIQNDNELVAQLSIRKYAVASNGMLQLERKREMKERGVKSPDRADAVALACFQQSRIYDEWAEKAQQLVITVQAALAMPATSIMIGISTAGHFGAAMVATMIIGDAQKAVVIGAKQINTVETNAMGKAFTEFAVQIWRTYKRLDYVYCDPDDNILLKSIKTASERRGLPGIVRFSINAELDDRIKLTARLIAQNRLYITDECQPLEQALSSASWSDSRSGARNDSMDASVLTAFEYTIERYITRFLRSEAVKR